LIALPVEILKGNGLISLCALSIYSTDMYCMVVDILHESSSYIASTAEREGVSGPRWQGANLDESRLGWETV
jgi:hypothetical protein